MTDSRYDEDTGVRFEIANPCERCGDPMTEDAIGECAECRGGEAEQHPDQDECICWPTDFSGRSVCGVPCPEHFRD